MDHLDDSTVRIIEVDVSPATYNKGHIPGAVLWNAYGDLRDADYRPIPWAEFEHVVRRSGISSDTTAVFYGYGAFLGYWLMASHGHPDVRVLKADRTAWESQGGAWSTEIPSPATTSYELPVEDKDLLTTRAGVDAAIEGGDTLILDVRSIDEFRGGRFWPSGATEGVGRAGHIPHAVHVPVDLIRGDDTALKDTEALRRLYEDAGVLPDKRVIVYCTIGNRASLVWFVLTRLLGYPNVSVYQGSYVEWGKLPDTLVETDAS
jgi:thiosulfate/3-mercaptopyruvate sulfurtransferase